MDPLTLFALGSTIEAGSGVLSGYLGYIEGKKQAKYLGYQAELIEEQALENEEVLTEQYEALEGRQIKQFSASGVAMTGSVLDVLAKTSKNKFRSIKDLRISAKRESNSLRRRGRQIRKKTRMDMYGSFLGAAGKGLSTAGSMQGK